MAALEARTVLEWSCDNCQTTPTDAPSQNRTIRVQTADVDVGDPWTHPQASLTQSRSSCAALVCACNIPQNKEMQTKTILAAKYHLIPVWISTKKQKHVS